MGKNITELPELPEYTETTIHVVDDGVQSYKATGAQIRTFMQGDLPGRVEYVEARAFVTGMILPWEFSTAPDGFVLLQGGTIGSASSGATARAHADTEALFTLIWESYDNTARPIQDDSGAPSTRGGSAAEDFAANKRLPLANELGNPETVFIQDQKANSTDGGDFIAGAWRTRTLNTLINPMGYSWIALASNEFTLQPGTYLIRARAPAYRVIVHKARLYNVTSGSVALWGSAAIAEDAANTTQNDSVIEGYLTPTAATTYRVEHRCSSNRSGNGFGDGNGDSIGGGTTEIFTQVKITKLPTYWIQKL